MNVGDGWRRERKEREENVCVCVSEREREKGREGQEKGTGKKRSLLLSQLAI